jgi:hypothetical protein
LNLTDVFVGLAAKAIRGFQIRPNRQVWIQDDLAGLKPGAVVRWAMVTSAKVAVDGRRATLQHNGKQLRIWAAIPGDARFQVISADPPADGFNAPNPGMRILLLNSQAPESGALRLGVLLQPGASPILEESFAVAAPEEWSAAF